MNFPTLPQLPPDKANHFLYGTLIFTAFHFFVPAITALEITAAFAIGKELVDFIGNRKQKAAGLAPSHGVEFLDAFATFAGGLICFANTF